MWNEDEKRNPKKVLQNYLPGVTLTDSTLHFRKEHTGKESRSESLSYYYHSYQSLYVSCPLSSDDELHVGWLHEQRKHHREKTRRRRLFFVVALGLVAVLARRQAHSSKQLYLQSKKKDDNRRDAILRALEKLDESMDGDIILQSEKPKFIDAARIWRQGNEPPLAVIQAKSQKDVALAVPILAGLSRDFSVEFRVRAGGYSPFVSSKGIILSLVELDALKLNISTNTVTMEPGVTTEDFMKSVLSDGGYAGIVPAAGRVAMGGFITGGGYGLLSRKQGLAIDNVVRLRVVLANGTMQDVQRGDDLFFAVLGTGGTNFGVVTEMEYLVRPCKDTKLVANVQLPINEAVAFLQRIGNVEAKLDRNVTVRLHSLPSTSSSLENDGTTATMPMSVISMYWMGNADPEIPDQIDYLKEHLVALLPGNFSDKVWFYYDSWTAMSQSVAQPETWKRIWAAQSWNGFLYPDYNTAEVWSQIHKSLSVLTHFAGHTIPTIELWGGAISSVSSNATAFPYREALYHIRVDLLVQKEANMTSNEADRAFAEEVEIVSAIWPSIAKYLNGSFVNYPMPNLASEEYAPLYWGENLQKLKELREQFDPSHVFQYRQSVPFPSTNSSYT